MSYKGKLHVEVLDGFIAMCFEALPIPLTCESGNLLTCRRGRRLHGGSLAAAGMVSNSAMTAGALARFDFWRIGGSHAQRDIIDWTLTEAAVRGGLRDIALSLAHERLGTRPRSAVNRNFLRRAEQIAA
jgi:hypothetical protein